MVSIKKASFALINYQHPFDGYANRDQSGGYGSKMAASGFMGPVLSYIKAQMLHLPLSYFGYISGILTRAGHIVRTYSQMPEGEDYIVIASSMAQCRNEIEFARQVKARFPKSMVGFMNTFSSVKPEMFAPVADFIIIGEPEWAFVEFAKGNIELTGNVRVEQSTALDTLGLPNWEPFPYKTFSYFPLLPKRPFFPVLSSRGCPYNCGFCPYIASQGNQWRTRSVDGVLAEIASLRANYGAKSILFRDPVFSMQTERAVEIAEGILRVAPGIEWSCETRIDCLTPELINIFYKSGLRSINLGIESYDNAILKKTGKKPIPHEHQNAIIDHLNGLGIRVASFFILGLLDDTIKSVRETIEYAKLLNTFSSQFCLLTPFPGTGFHETVKERILTEDFSKFTAYEPVVRLDNISPDEMVKLRDEAFNGYYMRPKWIGAHGLKTLKCLIDWL